MPSFEITSPNHSNATVVNLRCPHCRHAGAFHGFDNCHDLIYNPVQSRVGTNIKTDYDRAGLRRCPNPECRKLVFVMEAQTKAVDAFPPERIDFDATALPPKILASLDEAIACHSASAYRACALMVRRVLEELCEDKSATGNNLKARIAALKTVAVIPDELLTAADELRILGNDAAHVEAKDYDAIGKDEAQLAVDLAKELLKAVYQYNSLVTRLRALKKASSP